MKILNLKILNPANEIIREVKFNEVGASIIWGEVSKPASKQDTTNSIGKTLLLRFIGYIFGKKEQRGQYDKIIYGWKLVATVLNNEKQYTVEKVLGNNNGIKLNGESMDYNEYLDYFTIKPGINAKQILYKRRVNIVSDVNQAPTKEDTINTLKLLKITNVIELYTEIRLLQNRVRAISSYETEFKDDLVELKKRKLFYEKEKAKLIKEVQVATDKLEKLEVAEASLVVMTDLTTKKYELKSLKLEQERYELKIKQLTELIADMNKTDIKASDVNAIFEQVLITLPEMVTRELDDVQVFYDAMFKDKEKQYRAEIKKYKANIVKLANPIKELAAEVDKMAAIVANNKLFAEVIAIYQRKNDELLKVQTEEANLAGCIENLAQKQTMEKEINVKYTVLELGLDEYDKLIHEYKQYVNDLVAQIYGAKNSALFDIRVSDSKRRLKSNPLVVELRLEGDFGEGISAVKNILIDALLFKYNDQIDYLIHDSSCFEGIDSRQLETIINIIHQTAMNTNKQYIFALNEYRMDYNDTEFSSLFKANSVIMLSETETLLDIRF